MQITRADAKHAVARLETIKKRIANIREQAEATTERLVTTAETAGAAFAMGVLQGKTGGVQLFGVPLELGLGLGLNAFALLGGAGKHSVHLNNVGNGCLAAYATTLGRGVGATWKDKSLGGSAPAQVEAARTSGLSPGDIAAVQRAAAGF